MQMRMQPRPTEYGSDEGIGLALVALAGVTGLIAEVGHDDLQQRDGGGDGSKHHQQIEQDAEQSAQGHFVEHILHGHKQQGRAAQSAGGVQGETAGDNAQTSHQGHHGIHDNDEQSVLFDVFLFMQVGAVGDHGAHAQRQGEEHLAAGSGNNGEEIGGFLNNTVFQSPAGNEHILQAVHSAGQGAGADDADEQDDEQSGIPTEQTFSIPPPMPPMTMIMVSRTKIRP